VGEFLNLLGMALVKGLEKGFEALDDSYLYGEGLDEKKELFETLLEKWKVFFNNLDSIGVIDREEKGRINIYKWKRGSRDIRGEMGICDVPLYLCKHNGREFFYSSGSDHYPDYYSDDNLDCYIADQRRNNTVLAGYEFDDSCFKTSFSSARERDVKIRARNIYFEFTKDGIMLSFAMHQEAGKGLKLSLAFQPNGEVLESASVYYSQPSRPNVPEGWCILTIREMLIKMGLNDMYEKISAFAKHFDSSDSFTEEMKTKIQEEMNEKKREIEDERRKKEHEEQEKQRAIDEKKRKQEEKMNRLKNL